MKPELIIDVPTIEPRLKHQTIFNEYDKLQPGTALMIHNDHDPKPLYYQLLAERGNTFTWQYEKEGPDFWDVTIGKRKDDEAIPTIGQLVSKDFRKAEVFKKFGLDFCCGGKKTVEAACSEKGVDTTLLQKELDKLDEKSEAANVNYAEWDSAFLIDYIINTHHNYLRRSIPLILEFSQKVARVHGDKHPETIVINTLFGKLAEELMHHIEKEETELFPYLKRLSQAENDKNVSESFNIAGVVTEFEDDHTTAGELLEKIHNFSSGYTAPEGACGTYRVLYSKLDEFEKDLHTHIHLENNILFPRMFPA